MVLQQKFQTLTSCFVEVMCLKYIQNLVTSSANCVTSESCDTLSLVSECSPKIGDLDDMSYVGLTCSMPEIFTNK